MVLAVFVEADSLLPEGIMHAGSVAAIFFKSNSQKEMQIYDKNLLVRHYLSCKDSNQMGQEPSFQIQRLTSTSATLYVTRGWAVTGGFFFCSVLRGMYRDLGLNSSCPGTPSQLLTSTSSLCAQVVWQWKSLFWEHLLLQDSISAFVALTEDSRGHEKCLVQLCLRWFLRWFYDLCSDFLGQNAMWESKEYRKAAQFAWSHRAGS